MAMQISSVSAISSVSSQFELLSIVIVQFAQTVLLGLVCSLRLQL